jgi:heme A synthase
MGWIELGSWIVMALLLARWHIRRRKEPLVRPSGVFTSAVFGALLGGWLVRMVGGSSFEIGGYSVAALLVAALLAEAGALTAVGSRAGHPAPPLSR